MRFTDISNQSRYSMLQTSLGTNQWNDEAACLLGTSHCLVCFEKAFPQRDVDPAAPVTLQQGCFGRLLAAAFLQCLQRDKQYSVQRKKAGIEDEYEGEIQHTVTLLVCSSHRVQPGL